MRTAALFSQNSVSPFIELGAYEALWAQDKQSYRKLAKLFKANHQLPSSLVDPQDARTFAHDVTEILKSKNLHNVQILVDGTIDFPKLLRAAQNFLPILYYRGLLDFLFAPCLVSIVGARNASEDGKKRAAKLAKHLVRDNVIVVSGLAKGIDTAAHTAAIDAGGKTIGVIGTPICEVYPPENADLQEEIANNHLLISQIPIKRYLSQTPKWNRLFFPQRNLTMSALSHATVIVEAGETSGSLIQGRAALNQQRQLFILDSCFQRGLKWPEKLLAAGAVRVSEYDDIKQRLTLQTPSY